MSKLIIITEDRHNFKKRPEDKAVFLVSDLQAVLLKQLIEDLVNMK